MAEATTTRKVSRSVQIAASPERVLKAFLDPEEIKKWWGATRALVEPRKGGVWAAAWGEAGQGYLYVVTGVLKSLQPGKRLRLDPLVYFSYKSEVLGPMRLSISVKEKAGKTRVSVRQDGYGTGPDWDWYYQSVFSGWKDTLGSLKQYLEEA